jgi:uncharacterized protein YyaL (SSP411 family)
MAEWELTVQLPNGAIPCLIARNPVVFDTGQVIFGWVSAFQLTEDERFLDAALKAGAWLNEVMDEDGAWRQWTASKTGDTYNARAAWALVELGLTGRQERFLAAARRFLDWSLKQETDEGWFRENCLNDNDHPLLHTIAYTAQGQLEAGVLLDDSQLVDAAARTARSLAGQIASDGRLAGRYNRAWRPSVPWACLTGMAQISAVWSRLHLLTQDALYAGVAEQANRFLMSTHDLSAKNGGLRGGIRGSFPVNGAYCRYRVPNWATKFFLDAILHAPSTGRQATFRG